MIDEAWMDNYEYVYYEASTGEFWYSNDESIIEEVDEANLTRERSFKQIRPGIQFDSKVTLRKKAEYIDHLNESKPTTTNWIVSQAKSVTGFDLSLFTINGLKKIYKETK